MLQSVLANILPHRGGLNPKTFRLAWLYVYLIFLLFNIEACLFLVYRQLNTTDRTLGNPCKGIIDGELVWEYINLPWKDKGDVAKKIGSKSDDIMEDLMEIDRISAHF